jgi:DNA-binding SARP family transcriptional activator
MTTPTLVSVLGPLAVEVGGRALPVGGPRRAGVLARLVVADGHAVSAETLAQDVWASSGAVDAARMAVSRLRQTLGADVIVTSANGYALDPNVCQSDAEVFEARLAEARQHPEPASCQVARYDNALALWRGEAYEGMRDLAWCLTEAERLDELRLAAISERIDARLRSGESTALIAELERLVEEHPWREHLTEQLMLALYRSGRQREALNAFHRLERTLREELGIEANPRARALHAAVLAQSPELDHVASLSGTPVTGPTRTSRLVVESGRKHSPLIGRGDEVGRLERAWQRAAAESRARVVLVSGAPGIGKSTLLDHVATGFAAAHGVVLRATCEPHDKVPFQAIADALEPFVAELGDRVLEPDLISLAAVLPGVGALPLSQPASAGEPAMHRALVRRSVERALQLCVDAQPTALVIDDLQWIDPGSLAFLGQAWPSLCDRSLLLVLACRANEMAIEGPITQFLSLVTEQSPVTTLELAGLDETSTSELVGELLPDDWVAGDRDEIGALIAERTLGHPFFVTELVHECIDADDPGAAIASATTATIDATIGQRLARLAADERALLNVAAVVGPSVPAGLLAAVVGRSSTDLTTDADGAVRAGLLRPTFPLPGWEFEHSMIRQILLEELPPAQRARLHASIAEAVEAAGGRPEELSHHFVNALPFVEPDRAARAALDAGDAAMDAAAFEDAALHYRRALDALGSASPDDGLRARVLVNLGNALATGTDAGPAMDCFQQAAELARRSSEAELYAEALVGRAQFGVRHETRDVDIAFVDEALDLLSDRDSWVRARLLMWGGWLMLYSDDSTRAHPYIDAAVAIAEHLDDSHALAGGLQVKHALLVAELAPLEERDRLRARIRELPSKQTRYEGTLINGASVFDDLVEHGDLTAMRRELDRYRRDADEIGRPYDRWSARSIRFVTEIWSGDLDAAEVAMNEAATLGASLGIGVAANAASAHLLVLAWERDQFGELVSFIEGGAAAAVQPLHWTPVVALAYHAAGRDDDARRMLTTLRGGYPEIRHPQPRAFMAFMASETVGLVGDDDLTRVIERELEPHSGRLFVAPTAIYTLGPYDRALGRCAMARGDLDLAVERLQAARLLAQKYGLAIWEPRAAVAEADARFRRGGRSDVEAARELLELVDRSAEAIGSALLERLAADVRARHES